MDVNLEEADIFDSLASPTRLQILRSLSRQPMNYSDLMKAVGMTRQRAAGRFAYHLKKLLAAELVRVNDKSKLYELSRKGMTVLQYVDNLKDELAGSEMMIVRRTESAVEAFDRNKIVNVLISEAGMPAKLASHLAMLAEEKLESLKVEYLTGSLIRELVNSLLIDMGLEKYRHRLTRLGMPLHDVEKMVGRAMEKDGIHHILRMTSGAVMKEYLLLNVLPRKVGDMYLSGTIDLHSPEMWIHGIYAKSYSLDGDGTISILDEAFSISKEIGLEISESSKRGLDRSSEVMAKLIPAGILAHLRISAHIPSGLSQETITHLKNTGVHNLIMPAIEPTTPLSDAIICIAQGPVTSSGYLYSPSKTIHGVVSINIPRAFLNSDGEESSLWDELGKAVDAAATAILKKVKGFFRLWRAEPPAYFIMAPCGLAEVFRKMGRADDVQFILDFAERLGEMCAKAGREGVRVLMAGGCDAEAAERFFKLDLLGFGRKSVMELAARVEGRYTTSILDCLGPTRALDAAAELAKHVPGGLSIRLGRNIRLEDAVNMLRGTISGDLYLISENSNAGS